MRSDFWSLPYAAQQAIRRGEAAESRARRARYSAAEAADAADQLREALIDWRNCWLCPETDFEREVPRLLKVTEAALSKYEGGGR